MAEKNFPVPGDIAAIPALHGLTGTMLGPDRKAIPAAPDLCQNGFGVRSQICGQSRDAEQIHRLR
ncbi:hypothetical protein ACIHDR_13655 [Nocardia sp. NPDC052278]|uniref:hypothetical protein n=1 Tax=unclassified Nocardia TaxID=2637762 RepID=UPI00368C670B